MWLIGPIEVREDVCGSAFNRSLPGASQALGLPTDVGGQVALQLFPSCSGRQSLSGLAAE